MEQVESRYDFTIYVIATESGLSLRLRFNSDLFDLPRMEKLLRQYLQILEQAADDPEAPIDALLLSRTQLEN